MGLMQAAEMRLMQAVFAMNQGDLQAGADTLMQEIRVHRRLLANSSQLLTKMIAAALLRRDYVVLSNAIEHWPQLARQTVLAEAWQPLSAQEYGLRREIESNAVWWATLQYTLPYVQQNLSWREVTEKSKNHEWGLKWLWLHLQYSPQTTVNTIARWASEDAQAVAGDPATMDARHKTYTAKRAAELKQMNSYAPWHFFRNPIGNTLLTIGYVDPFVYAERIQDLNGTIRLVALQAALRRDGVPPAQIADYVQRAGPNLRNPYDGHPMHWNAARATLSFQGREKSPSNPDNAPKTFSVRLKLGAAQGN
jgi:hypothetical protein